MNLKRSRTYVRVFQSRIRTVVIALFAVTLLAKALNAVDQKPMKFFASVLAKSKFANAQQSGKRC